MTSRWFTTSNGKQRHGPFSDTQLKQLASSGRLLPSDMLWRREHQSGFPPARSTDYFRKSRTRRFAYSRAQLTLRLKPLLAKL